MPTGAKKAARCARAHSATSGTDFMVTKVLLGDQRRRLPRTGRAGGQHHAALQRALHSRGARRAAGRARRVVSARHVRVPARERAAHLLQHAHALVVRPRRSRTLLGRSALPRRLLRLDPGGLGRCALLVSPTRCTTMGASGAVFGILGAGPDPRAEPTSTSSAGTALIVVILNLALSFTLNSVSIGGPRRRPRRRRSLRPRFSGFGRGHAVVRRGSTSPPRPSLVAIAAGSVLIAYFKVRGYA